MAVLKQNTAYQRMFLMVQSADHVSGLTGAAPVVQIAKTSNTLVSFVTATNSPATEIAFGWYFINLTAADTNTIGDMAYHITATNGDPTDFVDQIQVHLLSDINIDAFGNVAIASNVKKNQALNGFPFQMTALATNAPISGLGSGVLAQRSLNGGGFAPCANAVTEISNGVYAINLAATDLNANTVMLRFTNAAANDQNIVIITQP